MFLFRPPVDPPNADAIGESSKNSRKKSTKSDDQDMGETFCASDDEMSNPKDGDSEGEGQERHVREQERRFANNARERWVQFQQYDRFFLVLF